MNVFYSPETHGLKEVPSFQYNDTVVETQTVYFTKPTVYSICSEGALYSSPRYVDGSFDPDNWVEVDFAEILACDGTVMHELMVAIQNCLVCDAIHDPKSGYYLQAAA